MLKLVQLLTNTSDDARRSVAGIEAANAAAEVEEHIAVDVDETCALGALEEDAVPRLGNSGGDKTPALLDQSPAPGSGSDVRMRIASPVNLATLSTSPSDFRSG